LIADATEIGETEAPKTAFLVNEGAMRKDKRKKPMVEVSFETSEFGVKLRQAYGRLNASWRDQMRQTGNDCVPPAFRGFYLNPALNHRTRVRVTVLKAIAKAYNEFNKGSNKSAWVIDHLPRPLLKTAEKAKRGEATEESYKVMGYVEAVEMAQKDTLLGRQDLVDSYKAAGRSYGRQLESYFIVLK